MTREQIVAALREVNPSYDVLPSAWRKTIGPGVTVADVIAALEGRKVWVVILEDRHIDVCVTVHDTEDGALLATTALVEEYDADDKKRGGSSQLVKTDHGDGSVSWSRDDGPYIRLEPAEVNP